MVFSSLVFLCIFLPAVFLSYTLVPSKRVKNGILIVTSLLFYAYGEPVYVFLMIGSTIVNYFFGLLVEKGKKGRRLKLGAAVFLNLLLLGVFKYAGMAAETVNQLTGAGIPVPQIVLPVGISFFTFQAMSYVIDVYRGQVDAQRSYWKVLLYISFFPQLIAGPIVKYYDIALEIENRQQNLTEVAEGFRRFCIGLSKKVLISNTVALAADAVFALPVSRVNILTAWIGAISYLLQIYYDFSGYSDMAIGLGKMFGFHLRRTFIILTRPEASRISGEDGICPFPPGLRSICIFRWEATARAKSEPASIKWWYFSAPACGMGPAGLLWSGGCITVCS